MLTESGGKHVGSEDPREPEPGCHDGQVGEIASDAPVSGF